MTLTASHETALGIPPKADVAAGAAEGAPKPRHDWTTDEILALHELPLFELVDRARAVHLAVHGDGIQLCSLLSVKTGGCVEDCGYCAQSSKYETATERERMLDVPSVLEAVERALVTGEGTLPEKGPAA